MVGRIQPASAPNHFLTILKKYHYDYYGVTVGVAGPLPSLQHWAFVTDDYLGTYGKFLILSYPRLDYALTVNTIYPKDYTKGGPIRTIKVVPVKHRFVNGARFYHLGDEFLWSAEFVKSYGPKEYPYSTDRFFLKHCQTGLVLTHFYYNYYNLVVADQQGDPTKENVDNQAWKL